MKKTDPRTGKYVAFMIKDFKFTEQHIKWLKEKFVINEKFVEYAIFYFPSKIFGGHSKPRAIIFDRISEIKRALEIHNAFMWRDVPDYIFPVWVSGHTLCMIIEVNEETLPVLRNLQKELKVPKNYTGRILQ